MSDTTLAGIYKHGTASFMTDINPKKLVAKEKKEKREAKEKGNKEIKNKNKNKNKEKAEGQSLNEVQPFESGELKILRLRHIKYRADYNGRPMAYVIDADNMLIRTHPIYCSSQGHYGRIYEYRWLCHNRIQFPTFRDDFLIYMHDNLIESLYGEIVNLIASLPSLGKDQKIMIAYGPHSSHVFIEHRSPLNETEIQELKANINAGSLPDQERGFIQYGQDFFRIYVKEYVSSTFEEKEKEEEDDDPVFHMEDMSKLFEKLYPRYNDVNQPVSDASTKVFIAKEWPGEGISSFIDRVIVKAYDKRITAFIGFIYNGLQIVGCVFAHGKRLKIAYYDL